ncbi:MAG TPA: hypothetical protein VE966_12080, partial [Gemmatimonadales bacterium]|nr:hypothetical protein [Gemmatimonadales bacterium]
MRPPILFLTIAFGIGLHGGLTVLVGRGAWYVVAPLLVAATLLHRRAPLGAAVGIMGVAGMLWGAAAGREKAATCTGRWTAAGTAGERARDKAGEEGRATRAAVVRLADPVSSDGGVVDAEVLPGDCGGVLRL